MNKLNDEIDKTKQIIIDGINIMVENIEKLEDLEVKSKILLENAKYFKKNAKTVNKYAWWSNCKWTIIKKCFNIYAWWSNCKWNIILILIIILLLIIIFPIGISVGKKKNDKNKEENNNNNTISNNNNGNINTKRRLRILYSENEYFSY